MGWNLLHVTELDDWDTELETSVEERLELGADLLSDDEVLKGADC